MILNQILIKKFLKPLLMIGCIIQARTGSTRLPGKVMMFLDEHKTVLDYVIEQLRYSKKIDQIVVATTDLKEDDVIVDKMIKQNIEYFRGNAEDVLDRYYACAKKFSISTILRITADNPLIDPTIIDKIIKKFTTDKFDYMSNTIQRTFPYGTEVEIFTFQTLEDAWHNATKPSEREHVTPYIRDHNNKFRLFNLTNDKNLSYLSWTIDRKNDLALAREIISKISKRPILMEDILELFKKEPKLMKINKNSNPKEGFLKSLKADEELRSTKR